MPLFRITVPASYARFLGGPVVVVDAGNALDARQAAVKLGVPFAVTQAQPTDEQGAVGLPRVQSPSSQQPGAGAPVPQPRQPAVSVVPEFDQTQGTGLSAGSVGEGESTRLGDPRSVRVTPSGRDIGAEAAQLPAATPSGLTEFDQFVTAIRQVVNTSNTRQDAERALSGLIAQARRLGFGETDISALVQQGNAQAAGRFPAAAGQQPGAGQGDGAAGPLAGSGGGGGLGGTPTGGVELQQFLDMLGPNAIREIRDPETGAVIGYELDPSIEAALGLYELNQGGTLERERLANALAQAGIQSNPFGRSADEDEQLRLALERGGLSIEDFFKLQTQLGSSELANTQAQYNPFGFSTDQALDLQNSLARGGLSPQERLAEIQAAQQAQNLQTQLNFLGNPSALGAAVGSGLLGGQQFQTPFGGSQQFQQQTPFAGPQAGGFQQLGGQQMAPGQQFTDMRWVDRGPAPDVSGVNLNLGPQQIEQMRRARASGGFQSGMQIDPRTGEPIGMPSTGFNAANPPRQQNLLGPAQQQGGGGGSFLSLGNLRGAPANPTFSTLRDRSDEEMGFLFGQSASRGVTPSAFLRQAGSRTPFGASRGSQVVPL